MNDKTYLYTFFVGWIGLMVIAVSGFLLIQYDFSTQDESNYDIEVEGEFVEGSEHIFTLKNEEESVEGAIASLNGEELGATDSNGELRHIFEEGGEKNIIFELDGVEISRTLEITEANDTETELPEGDETEEYGAVISYNPENPVVGEQVSITGEDSEGDIQEFNWLSDDIELEQYSGELITHEFENPGLFEIQLEINTTQGIDSTVAEIEVQEADDEEIDEDGESEEEEVVQPEIQLNQPEATEYHNNQIDYNFDVTNGLSGSEYTIIIDGSDMYLGQLEEEGTQQIEQTISLEPGQYTTSVQLEQNNQIYQTETREIEIIEGPKEPQFSLNSPQDGDTIETFEEETEVDFEFTVENREWAEEATIEIEETNDEYTRTISSDQTYGANFNPLLESSEAGEEYTWIVTLRGDNSEISDKKTFNLTKVKPEFEVLEMNEEVLENGYEVDFELAFTAERDTEIRSFYVDQGEEFLMSENWVDQDTSQIEFSETFPEGGEYEWYVEAEDMYTGDIIKTSETSSFETSEPDDEEDDDDTGSPGDPEEE